MGKGKAIALGLLTVWPLLYMFIFMGFFLVSFLSMGSGPEAGGFPVSFAIIFPFHMFTMLSMFALLAIYLVHVIKNKDLEDNMRIIWVILVIMVGMGAMPAYWWLYIWNEAEETSP